MATHCQHCGRKKATDKGHLCKSCRWRLNIAHRNKRGSDGRWTKKTEKAAGQRKA